AAQFRIPEMAVGNKGSGSVGRLNICSCHYSIGSGSQAHITANLAMGDTELQVVVAHLKNTGHVNTEAELTFIDIPGTHNTVLGGQFTHATRHAEGVFAGFYVVAGNLIRHSVII